MHNERSYLDFLEAFQSNKKKKKNLILKLEQGQIYGVDSGAGEALIMEVKGGSFWKV